jgi:hypothetical protein
MRAFVRICVTLAAVLALSLVAGPVAGAAPPTPAIDYRFQGNLTDSGGGSTATQSAPCPADPCISASSFGTNATGPYWQWASTQANDNGGGLRIVTSAAMGTTYTLILEFQFNETDGYRKIIDYKNRVVDRGFYIDDGFLDFYNLEEAAEPELFADTPYYLVAVRQSTGGTAGTFTVYMKTPSGSFIEVFEVDDPTGQSLFADEGGGSVIGLFYDDTAVQGEAPTGGKVYGFTAWPGQALTLTEIEEYLGFGPPPTPPPTPEPEPAPQPRFTG